jgi:hypothetical protein
VKLCPFGYDYLKGHFCVEKKEYLKSISGLKGERNWQWERLSALS